MSEAMSHRPERDEQESQTAPDVQEHEVHDEAAGREEALADQRGVEDDERVQMLRELLRRSCCQTQAPSTLRERITVQYRSVQITRSGPDGTSTVRMTSTRRTLPPQD